MANNIEYFFKPNQRHENAKFNDYRESVLSVLHNPPVDYLEDPVYKNQWSSLSIKWNQILKTLCGSEYDDVHVIRKGGSGCTYDCEVHFLKDNVNFKSIEVEFKFNKQNLKQIPQYFEVSSKNKLFNGTLYAEYFYDNYLDKLCSLSETPLEKPSKEFYLKYVHSFPSKDSDIPEFFKKLKKIQSDSKFKKTFEQISKQSIKSYLESHGKKDLIDINFVKNKMTHQKNKKFVFWKNDTFLLDTFNQDDLIIEDFVKILRNNTLVFKSRNGVEHGITLRWANRLCVLNPSFKFKLLKR